jgi:hypothetical protein
MLPALRAENCFPSCVECQSKDGKFYIKHNCIKLCFEQLGEDMKDSARGYLYGY